MQKFDNSDPYYQTIERIAQKDYDKIAEDIKRNGASGRIQSIQRAFTDLAQFNKQRDSARRAESNSHSLQVEHGGENKEVFRDPKAATSEGQTQNDGSGNSESGGSGKQIKYSLKTVKYIPYDKVGSDNIRAIRKKLNDLYQGVDDTVADGIAIKNGDMIYVVDSGKDNGDVRFGIRNRYVIDDAELRAIHLEDINERALSKGFISHKLFEKIGGSSDNDSRGGYRGELQKELSVNTRESAHNEGRISDNDGDRGIRGLKYSLKTAKYIPYDKVGSDNIRAIRKKLNDLYQGIDDTVADGIAIENGDTIYVVDSGNDNGDVRFGIRRKIRIEDNDRRKEYIRNINKESEENDFGNRTIFERTRINLGNDSGLNVGRQYRENLPTSKRKSDDYERGTSSKNGSRGVQVLKYSVKTDSDGRQLTKGQREYFKDSKVVDKNGFWGRASENTSRFKVSNSSAINGETISKIFRGEYKWR